VQEAIDAFEASRLASDVFGEDLHAAYVEFNRAEWEDFHNSVSECEWNRYLTLY
jgi:glutamine synthetase